MSLFTLKDPAKTRWDIVALGEVMLRLDPGEGRIRTAREFRVWEGGGEYNVARALRRCFGQRATVVTANVQNEVGYLLEDLMLQGGVDLSHMQWLPFDGIGFDARIGLNFTERGFGIRGAVGCSDRAHSAASKLKPGMIDWKKIFAEEGARWFHTGGIFAALSATTPDVVIEAVQAARAAGTIVSYDLNYRASLWKRHGGSARAIEVNKAIAPYIDVMIGNEEDFTACLGLEVADIGDDFSELDPTKFKAMLDTAVKAYPNFKVVATTLRHARTATFNDWGAVVWADGQMYEAPLRENLEILDRVGGGDGFASGMIYAFLQGKPASEAVAWGAAHGALAMTTPGDTSMARLDEVKAALKGGAARVIR